MAMVLDGLRQIYGSMRAQQLDRQRFIYTKGEARFEVFFFIDTKPFELLFSAIGHNFVFSYEVGQGFVVANPNLTKEEYRKLCEVLGLTFDAGNPFSPRAFLADFNENIPTTAHPDRTPKPHETARVYRNVEEADKIYHFGFLDNNKLKNQVTTENLDKTKRLLGQKIHDFCVKKNLSSKWTDNPDVADKNFPLPAYESPQF